MDGVSGTAGRPDSLRRLWLAAALGLLAIVVAFASASNGTAASGTGLQRAMQVQERNSERLLDRGDVVGTGVSWGSPASPGRSARCASPRARSPTTPARATGAATAAVAVANPTSARPTSFRGRSRSASRPATSKSARRGRSGRGSPTAPATSRRAAQLHRGERSRRGDRHRCQRAERSPGRQLDPLRRLRHAVVGNAGTARFVNQIFVEGRRGPFIKSGDSGSLLVTDDAAAKPVGLLFAGNSSGKFAIANRIDTVLAEFGVTIDGK